MIHSIWGFCDQCELWRFSAEWYLLSAIAKCPECKATTALIEKIDGSETRIDLKLELPPGAELPLLAWPVEASRADEAPLRYKGEILGTVEAARVRGAKAAATVQFELDDIHRNRIMVQELA